MALLHAMLDGAMVAAELLALMFVSPLAEESAAPTAPPAFERPLQVHRRSTTVDVRLLGSLADVRVAQSVHNVSPATVDLAPHMPVVDEHVEALSFVHATQSVELLRMGGCDDLPTEAKVRLAEDERVADALQLGPGANAVPEAIAARPLVGRGGRYRIMLPVRVQSETPRSTLFQRAGQDFLLLLPHQAAADATLVLRPATGESKTFHLGAVDTRHAVLVPLGPTSRLAALRAGAIELQLANPGSTTWLTLAVDEPDDRIAIHVETD